MTEIMGQKPASAYQSPYAPKASASTIQSSLPDSAFNNRPPPGITSLSSGMLGSAGNPIGSKTQVGSGVTSNPAVPSFSNKDVPEKSPALPASSPSATSSPATATPPTGGLSVTSPATTPATASAASSNTNDLSLANKWNDAADKMKADRIASYGTPSALPETPVATPAQTNNPLGNTPIGQQMFTGLANQQLGKGYGGLAGIGAMMGGTDGLPSGNFGDRAKRNKILNERGQQYMNGLSATQTV